MDLSIINWLAVLVAALSGFAVGSLWYSPILFGKIWQKESGMTDEKIKSGNMGKIFAITYLFEHKSLKLWLINAGYQAVIFTVIGGILGAWH